MPRAPFQVLVLPYRWTATHYEFAVFRRADADCWQGIAGGGEDDETPLAAAKREAFEEGKIPQTSEFTILQTLSSVPVDLFKDTDHWDKSLFVNPEFTFGVDCTGVEVTLSHEHSDSSWLSYDEARCRLTFDSNRTALWELNQRLLR